MKINRIPSALAVAATAAMAAEPISPDRQKAPDAAGWRLVENKTPRGPVKPTAKWVADVKGKSALQFAGIAWLKITPAGSAR